MISNWEVIETNEMIEKENLDVRTITLGISLLDCIYSDLTKLNENIYNKITTVAKDLVATGKEIESNYSIPIVNKRISVTPIALIGGAACKTPEDFATIAERVPSVFMHLSAGFLDERGDYPPHNPKVLFNEDVLPMGAAGYAYCAEKWLENHK